MHKRHQERILLALALPLLLAGSASCGAAHGKSGTATAGIRDTTAGAYGSSRTRGRTAMVSRVTQEDIDRAGNMNLGEFIESRMTGVRVVRNRADYVVYITGASFQSAVGALVIIDGTEGSLAGLTMHDVSSIEVLKDSAASIYGVRGSNGVLVLTTRKR
jgi:TonB-dependent SusC/RagA subfamily outer membrane receptor